MEGCFHRFHGSKQTTRCPLFDQRLLRDSPSCKPPPGSSTGTTCSLITTMNLDSHISYLEATARGRIACLLDPASFREFIPPTLKRISPPLGLFDAPVAFDDGAIIGEGKIDGKDVYIFAQEGKFRGGSLGEVHSAKITGLLRRAAQRQPAAVIGLFDSGGGRLEEANAGQIGA